MSGPLPTAPPCRASAAHDPPPRATLTLGARTRVLAPDLIATDDPVRLLRLDPGHPATVTLLRGRPVAAAAFGPRTARRLVASGAVDLDPRGGALATPAEVRARVTVVVPVRDRPEELERCLRALGGATAVIVVDDASSDPTAIAAVARRHGAHLVRHAVNGGPGAARTTGLERATTELVAFVDSDVTVDPDPPLGTANTPHGPPAHGLAPDGAPDGSAAGRWLRGLVPVMDDPTVAVVAPRIASRPGPTALARYEVAHSPLDLGPDRATVHPAGRVAYLPSATWLVRRSALAAGFTPGMRVAEDVDAIWRLHAAGWRCVHHPEVVVHHAPRPTVRRAAAQRATYATGATRLATGHPGAAPPLRLTAWTALCLVGLLSLRPAGLALATVTSTVVTVRLARRLRPVLGGTGAPAGRALRIAAGLVVRGVQGTLRASPRAALRAWPAGVVVLGVAAPRVGVALACGWAVDLACQRWDRRSDPRSTAGPGLPLEVAGRLLDDLAYASGLWRGAWRARSAAALWPRSARRLGQAGDPGPVGHDRRAPAGR